ncbi:MAG: nuclease [Betaproteobacteria bacterium]|nr:nuclease [Betaproteobacteria bacterium]
MAHLSPSLPPRAAINAGEYAELGLLKTLQTGLSDAYTLFHSVDWSRSSGGREQHGEIDIVVVNQSGDVLLIEVKSGGVDFQSDGIFKTYGDQRKSVTWQVTRQYGAMRSRLAAANLAVQVSQLLVLPDAQVQSETAQWPREQIVDSTEFEQVVSRVAGVLGSGSPNDIQPKVLAFFENRFRVVPDVSALTGRLQQSVTRLSAGLATWVPRIEVPSGIIRVVGTAGSGKTQLALRMLREADAVGQRAAYLCFNRALADHMAKVLPVRVPAETFHEFAVRIARRFGMPVDFSSRSFFREVEAHCIERLAGSEPDLDFIVLDEVQDFHPEWVQALLSRLRPKLINLLGLTATEVEASSDFEGEVSDPIVYDRSEHLVAATIKGVQRCLDCGFALHDIAVISLRGRDSSALQHLDQLGPWRTRHFTGAFDEGGDAEWTEGDLLVESVRRFKGQAAVAVVLTECELADLGELNRRLLFVGLTRARVHLEWVVSKTTEALLAQVLQG